MNFTGKIKDKIKSLRKTRFVDNNKVLDNLRKSGNSKVEYPSDLKGRVRGDVPEGYELVIGIIASNTKAKEEKNNGKRILAGILAAGMLIGIPLSFKGCAKDSSNAYSQSKPTPISEEYTEENTYTIFDVDNPAEAGYGIVNAAGQEGMTANALNGDDVFHGTYYDSDEQAQKEEDAASGKKAFDTAQESMRENADNLLTDSSSIQEFIVDLETMREIYGNYDELIEQSQKNFEIASTAFSDTRTDDEISISKGIVEDFQQNKDLATLNVETAHQIEQDIANGGTVTSVTREPDGDITITIEITDEQLVKVTGDCTESGIQGAISDARAFFAKAKEQAKLSQLNSQQGQSSSQQGQSSSQQDQSDSQQEQSSSQKDQSDSQQDQSGTNDQQSQDNDNKER